MPMSTIYCSNYIEELKLLKESSSHHVHIENWLNKIPRVVDFKNSTNEAENRRRGDSYSIFQIELMAPVAQHTINSAGNSWLRQVAL